MPKYGVHTIVLSEAIEKLASSSDPFDQQARTDVLNHWDSAHLGAIGPDIFFWAPDYEVVSFIYPLYKNLADLVAAFNRLVQPMKDLVEGVDLAVDAVGGMLLPGVTELYNVVIEELEETKELFAATLATGLFDGVVDGGFNFIENAAGLHSISATLFNKFRPPLQDNLGIASWYWFDMLHYRNTGEFARNLIALSDVGSPIQRAYAYGYLSHIATDLLGHSYVNQIVGGPYRTQVQRHVTVENYIDTWAYFKKYQEAINQTLFERLNLPSPPLPSELNDLLWKGFQKTYSGDHPHRLGGDGFLTSKQIDITYEVFYDVFCWMGKMGISRPTEPFSNVAEVLAGILADLVEPPPSPPTSTSTHGCGWRDIFSFGSSHHSRECYEEFFENVADYLSYLGELIVYALETLGDIWNLLTTALAALPVSAVLALLYAAQLILYDMYMTSHEALAIEGYVLPYPSSLDTSVGNNLITPFLECSKYPWMYNAGSTSHLVCPGGLEGGLQELPSTVPDFYPPSGGIYPDQFIRLLPFSVSNLQAYAQADEPKKTLDYNEKKFRIGNAVEMTQWMISNSANPVKRTQLEKHIFANWNLDADRGYAYKTWKGIIPSGSCHDPVNENYV